MKRNDTTQHTEHTHTHRERESRVGTPVHADGGLCSNIKVDGDSLFWVDVLRRHEVAWTIGPNGNQPERER